MESGEDAELCAYQDNHSGQTRISIHDGPLSKSTCKLLNRVVPNGTLRGVEGEGQISPIRFNFLAHLSVRSHTSGYGSAAYPGLSFEVVRFQSKDEGEAG